MPSRVHRRGPASITANLTPLIDMSFLLIVFFILVAQFSDRQRVPLDLPKPQAPASAVAEEKRRITINIAPRPDAPATIDRIVAAGVEHPPDRPGREALAAQISQLFAESPELRLNVRADRRLEYRYVEPVLKAIAEGAARAGATPRVNLVVVRE